MVCPSCGTAVEVPGKFCATCGAALPELPVSEATNQEAAAPSNVEPAAAAEAPPQEAAPEAPPQEAAPEAAIVAAPAVPPAVQPAAPAPPAWTQQPPAQPVPPLWTPPGPTAPAQPAPPQWTQQPPAQPAPAPYTAQQPYGAPQYGAPQAPGYGAPQYGAPGYAVAQPRAAASARSGLPMIGGLLAAAGGAAAVGSAWLAWEATKTGDALIKPIDLAVDSKNLTELATGPYLIGAGALAAVCGLLLLIGIARTRGLRGLLAVGAALGGMAVLAVEYTAYGHVNDSITAFGSFAAVGIGLYIGAAGGVAAILGGVLALASNP